MDKQAYLIWSNEHRLWWRADCKGYVADWRNAGRYSRDDAIGICASSRNGWEGTPPPEIPVREEDAESCALQFSALMAPIGGAETSHGR